MTSIRSQLLTRLLPGFFLLWTGTGTTIYLAVKANLESSLDAELREIARALPFGTTARSSLSPFSLEDFSSDDLGVYFEIWASPNFRLLKSSNLGGFDLQPPEEFSEEGTTGDQELDTGDTVRTLAYLSSDESDPLFPEVRVMVAKTRSPLDETLKQLLTGIIVIGLLGAVVFTFLAAWALRAGLAPLRSLGDQASRIDADSLAARFPTDGMPHELAPIVDRLNDLITRLEHSFHRERRFSADLAHELRNPVAALRSISEVAQKWPERVSGDEFEDVQIISTELQSTLENMLTLARLEKSEEQLRTEPISIAHLVREMESVYREQARERNLEVRIDVPESLLVDTEPRLLRTILSNLFSNAVEYAPEESDIRVVAVEEKSGEDESVSILISNPAPHLERTDIPKLFERLWRHDTARTDSSHTGLGLSIAAICAEQIGAEFNAELDPANRLVFRLVFD